MSAMRTHMQEYEDAYIRAGIYRQCDRDADKKTDRQAGGGVTLSGGGPLVA